MGLREGPPPVTAVSRDQALPLSFAQQRLWSLAQAEPGSVTDNLSMLVRLGGTLDAAALTAAVNAVVGRHEVLRTRLVAGSDGAARQVIDPPAPVRIPVADVSAEAHRVRVAERLVAADAVTPFDLTRGPLIRGCLIRLAADEHMLALSMHHAVSDERSGRIFERELAALYEAFRAGEPDPLPPLNLQYADFAAWQREWFAGDVLERNLTYWRDQLADAPTLELPTDRPRPPVRSSAGAAVRFTVRAATAQALRAVARAGEAEPATVLLAAFAVVLGRTCGQREVVIGASAADRHRAGTEDLIGFFADPLPVRIDLSGDPAFTELLARVRRTALGAHAHQDLPFARLADTWDAERLRGLFHCSGSAAGQSGTLGTTTIARSDLRLVVTDDGETLSGAIEYRTDLFDAATVERTAGHLATLLESVAADPGRPLSRVPMLTGTELDVLLNGWNDTAAPLPAAAGVHELIAAAAAAFPDVLALTCGGTALTYAGLLARAGRLAHRLSAAGVGAESIVGLCLERGVDTVVAVLAVWQAGGAYLPLDPDHPAHRLEFMLADSGVDVLVGHRSAAAGLALDALVESAVWLDDPATAAEVAALPPTAPEAAPALPGQLAYAIYTSGSTGRPKGVLVPHDGVINLATALRPAFGVTVGARALQFASFSFDAALMDLAVVLAGGGTLVIATSRERTEPALLAAAVRSAGVLSTSVAPSLLSSLDPADLPDVTGLFVGSERVDEQVVRDWAPGRRMFNGYGPTEITVISCTEQIDAGAVGAPPIGRPLANTRAYVLDEWLHPVPVGVAGDLYIGGAGVARGYGGRPALTAERFVADPFAADGTRLYRSGDRVRWRPDGRLEFLGRADDQLKVRGFRVEPGEIEAVLTAHPVVRTAVVTAFADGGDRRLVAYVVPYGDDDRATEPGGADAERRVGEWLQVYDAMYRAADEAGLGRDFSGWTSSYNGVPIPSEEMLRWRDGAVRRIRSLRPARVLEIGVGSGLLLAQLAPHCEEYWATDFSALAIDRLREQVAARPELAGRVVLRHRTADDLDGLPAGRFDTIVLNSVAQYFPGADYLTEVLTRAVELLAPGGALFVGDVRNRRTLRLLHTAVELRRAEPDAPAADIRRAVEHALVAEKELLVDPDFFTALSAALPRVTGVDLRLQRGEYHNEMTRHRYDVVLHTRADLSDLARVPAFRWGDDVSGPAGLAELLAARSPAPLRVIGMPNGRLAGEAAATRALGEGLSPREAAALLADGSGLDPEHLHGLAAEAGYRAVVTWSGDLADDRMEAVFMPAAEAGSPALTGTFVPRAGARPLSARANTPITSLDVGVLASELRRHVARALPEYMVPATVVALAALPLTPNGKLDRAALPAPEVTVSDRVPRTAREEILCDVFAEALGLPRVGIDDGFFELGGHSLLAVRVLSRIHELFGIELGLPALFEQPTVAGLARALAGSPEGVVAPPVTAVDRDRELPLSSGQQRLWFLDRLEPGSAAYNVPVPQRWTGPCDVAALGAALTALTTRHEVLRTRLVTGPDGTPHQVIDPPAPFPLPVADVTGEQDPRAAADRLVGQDAPAPFDLVGGPLIRALLIRLGQAEHLLALAVHHVVFDEWSHRILRTELDALYEAIRDGEPDPLPPLPVQYADFAKWQRDRLSGDVPERGLAYWREQLADLPALDLPVDRPRPPTRSTDGAVTEFTVPVATTEGLRAVARENGATMSMTLLAAVDVVLGRYCGTEDVVVGTPVAGRDRAEAQDLIGFFVNTLVLRTDLSEDPTFTELLGRVRRTALDAYAHQDVPFERLVDALVTERDRSRTPLFQVMFGYSARDGDHTVETVAPGMLPVRFDLEFRLVETGDALAGSVEYSTALFDAATADRMAGHLVTLLEAVAADPGRPLSRLPMLTPAERDTLLRDGDGDGDGDDRDAAPMPAASGVHQLIAAQAVAAPDAVAVVCGTASLSYAGLVERANRLAHHLRGLGVGPETTVGLCLPHTPDMVVAVLAVWQAQGAYLPLDPDYPADRLAFMLADSRARVLVTHGTAAAGPAAVDTVVRLDDPATAAVLAALPGTAPEHLAVRAGQAAYVIYTSGSTGRPKGVEVAHAGVVNMATALRPVLGAGPGVRVLQFASFSFDASVLDMAVVLAAGGTLTVATALERAEPELLTALIRDGGVRATSVTPSLLGMLDPARTAGLQTLLLGAEPLTEQVAAAWTGGRELVNTYGPTEATVMVTTGAVGPDVQGPPPIGTPLPGNRLYVLDTRLDVVPVGVAGEIFIAGRQVARGYRGRAALTAERFVADPFTADGTRMYRTGDRARRLPDGRLEILGRADHQLKVRGFRIEPGEIEAALTAHPRVRSAVVTAAGDGSDRTLVAHLVPDGPLPAAAELREFAATRLPAFMLPSLFVELDELPLSPNGKLDRAALPAPDATRLGGNAFVAPASPSEELLAGIWARVLGVDRVGAEDDFFELGGHSLLATQVTSRIRDVFGVEAPLSVLFDRRTVRDLAAWADSATRGIVLSPVTVADRDEPLPLSFAQQRLWFLDQLDPGSPEYNLTIPVRLGALDVEALGAALSTVPARHEVLRTRLVAGADGVAHQVIDPPSPCPLPVVDLSHSADPLAAARALVAADAVTPFDLAGGPLIRALLIRLDPDEHVLALSMHHVVFDEWSYRIFQRELSALYRAYRAGGPDPLPPLALQYADYAVRQRQNLTEQVLDGQLSYWRRKLAALPELKLPADRPRPPVRSIEGAVAGFTVPAATAEGLRAVARGNGATMAMTLLAGLAVVLGRYCGTEDVVVGTPVAGRNRAEAEDLIGFFANMLVMRTDLSGDPSFDEIVARVRETALDAYAHQDLPFEQLVDALVTGRDRSRTPLFQVVFNYATADPADRTEDGTLGDASGGSLGADVLAGSLPVKFDLVVLLGDREDGLVGEMQYSTALFDAATIERLTGHLISLLGAVAADPAHRSAKLQLTTPAERDLLVREWNGPAVPAPVTHGAPELITARAAATPDAVALVCDGAALTYAGLMARANRLAHHLRAAGAGPETVVGLCLERGVDMVVSMLAVWQAGAAHLPLDPAHPPERLAFMLADSSARVVVTRSGRTDLAPADGTRLVVLDDPRTAAAIAARPLDAPEVATHPAGLAYVIYTSGSTGRPKGVLIPHTNLTALFDAADATLGIGSDDVWSVCHSYAFDFSVWEIWGALTRGARCVLVPMNTVRAPERLGALVAAEGVTVLSATPELFRQLSRAAATAGRRFARLRLVVLGGDELTRPHLTAWYERYGLDTPALVNMYGITETTVHVTHHRVTAPEPGRGPRVPIGRALPGWRVHVLDEAMNPAPVGVPGEVFVGGSGVARGYGGRAALTAERFVADPFAADGSRLYRSGDRARWLPGGVLEYLGRADGRLKLRGIRIEPGEIEAALTAHPRIRTGVVSAFGSGADQRLAAYLVPADPDTGLPAPGELRDLLRRSLPEYMVPAAFVELAALPLTANGKLDRAALPAPESGRPDTAGFVAPRGATEELLAGIWADVLGVERVGAEDVFFDLGGHSLLATQVISRVRTACDTEVPLSVLFDRPTVRALAAAIETAERGATAPPVTAAGRDEPLPLSFAQQRLWFLDRLEPGSLEYNLPMYMRRDGPLDVASLGAALTALTGRHEVLRTRLVAGADGVAHQVIDPPAPFPLPVTDLTGAADPYGTAQLLATRDAVTPFDMAAEPLLRSCLLRLGPDEHILVLSTHHAVFDEWSAGIFQRELLALYEAFRDGEPDPLPSPAVQYADFAVWQRAWLSGELLEAQLAYWRGQLTGAPVLELPTDRPRPPVRSMAGAMTRFTVPPEVADGLRAVAADGGATMFMTLLSVYAMLLGRYCGTDDVVIGTPIANRDRAETEDVIGLFLNTLVIRADLSGDPTFAALLDRVRTTALDAYAHQDLPFEQLVDALTTDRDRSRTPIFQALFNYDTVDPSATADEGRLTLGALNPGEVIAKFDLRLILVDDGRTLDGTIEYGTALFDATTIERMTGHLVALLEAVAADATRPALDFPLVTAGERDLLLDEWSGAAAVPAHGPDLTHELIAARAATYPAAVSVVAGTEQVTYAELSERAGRLAHYLRGAGVGPETVVGLCLPRGADMVVAVLAVWQAGGAYLPLDPAYPPERLAFMLADSRATVLVGTSDIVDDLPAGRLRTISLDESAVRAALSTLPTTPPGTTTRPAQTAYVIYTSGSTGRPKGVQVTHGGLAAYLAAYVAEVLEPAGLAEPGTRHALLQAQVTDLGNTVVFSSLATGGVLHILDQDAVTDPSAVAGYLAEHRIDHLKVVPSHLAALAAEAGQAALIPRRGLVLGGEAAPADWVRELLAAAGDRLVVNHYGPTETTIGVVTTPLTEDLLRGGTVPIGTPLAGTRVYVLDDRLRPVPVGVTGDLYVGGAQVARGYAGRPAPTAERFLADPFAGNGSRLYRTGDRARWRADGKLEFHGRADGQLKVRGHRIEPGEVQAALLAHAAVRAAVVTVDGTGAERRLVAHLVPSDTDTGIPPVGELRAHLGGRLPDFMIPALFTELASLPLTPTGKLDLAALPAPDGARPELGGFLAPSGATEEPLARIWAQVLGVDRIGAEDDFFELGGHSLLATQAISRIHEVFGADIPLAALFDQPTVRALARVIDEAGPGTSSSPVTPMDRDGRLPLSFAQQRLWFLDQLEPGSGEYNTQLPLPLGEDVDVAALGAAMAALVTRHEVLRTRLVADADGVARQVIDPPSPFTLPVVDAGSATVARQLMTQDAAAPFDLASGPLLRALLLRTAARDHVLALSMHHVIFDEWSGRVLRRDLAALYEAFRVGEPDPLPPLAVQYADFSVWQRQWLTGEVLERQLDYWQRHLAGAPELELPLDRPRPPVRSGVGDWLAFTVPPETAEGLRRVARAGGASMFMTLLAAFSVVLGRSCGQDDVVVGTPVAGRNRAETEDLIGFFVNTLVMRTDLSGDPTFSELLGRVREAAFGAYANQDLPFEQLVDALETSRNRSHTPLFQVLFGYDTNTTGAGVGGGAGDAGGLVQVDLEPDGPPAAKFDLALRLGDTGESMTGEIKYSTALFDTATVERLLSHLLTFLDAVAAGPERPLSMLSMVTVAERGVLVGEWNNTAVALPGVGGVHELVVGRAGVCPDAVAVVCGGVSLTYGGLLERAGRVACYLRGVGVGAESVVGLRLGRGVDMVVAVLGVWQAGGAFLPLDPEYPVERLEFMVGDSGAGIVLGPDEMAVALAGPSRACDLVTRAGQLAYVIYTSGSTGRPKGVQVTHGGVVNLAVALGPVLGVGVGVRSLQFASFSFDASVLDVAAVLVAGGTLVVAPSADRAEPAGLSSMVVAGGVASASVPPSLLGMLDPAGLAGVSSLLVGSERVSGRVAAEWAPGRRLFIGYGPTEATVISCVAAVGVADEDLGAPSIGSPVANTRVYVLDERL
ncbi:amino acid adenylation domain-containing protein, partial [Streptomyces sp. NPDC048484]|uniref:amino acid adenylation domain-containing protein n=1 Tax=Streptomyces sp. NPDC048484 TaxID=3155146 RepID=UPI0034157345